MSSLNLPKIQSNIYKLDNFFFDLDNPEDEIVELVEGFSKIEQHNSYILLQIKKELAQQSGFNSLLFVSEDKSRVPDWLQFVNGIVEEDEIEKTVHLRRKYPSFLLFIYNKKSIYCITKGAGHYVISEKIVPDFGIQVLECLIDNEQTELRKANERGVIGPILQRSRFFRGNYKLSDERSIGMFYKDIDAYINKDKLKKLLNIDTDKAALVLGGKSSLEINSALSFSELHDRIKRIESLLIRREKGEFKKLNKFHRVSQKNLERKKHPGSPSLKMQLEDNLIQSIFYFLKDDSNDLEIYHPDIIKFAEASNFTFFWYNNERITIEIDKSESLTLKKVLRKFKINIDGISISDFSKRIKEISGALGIGDDIDFTKMLFHWINYETVFNSVKYFYLDGDWFIFEEDFKKQTEVDIANLFKKLDKQNSILKDWKFMITKSGTFSVNEGKYNLEYRDEKNCIVCDKALLNMIEICDFFELKEDKAILFHVKNGLGTSTRVVYNQIMNGASLLYNLRSGNKTKEIKKYSEVIKKQNYTDRSFDNNLVMRLLNVKEIEFCLVYATESIKSREDELKNSQSFIAKLSILQCEHDLRANFDFKFNLAKVRLVKP